MSTQDSVVEQMGCKPKPMPSREELNALFEYKDGKLYRRPGACAGRVKAGAPAGCPDGKGYLAVSIKTKKYLVHRIVWVMHGRPAAPFIDHINGDKLDNRIENLRAADYWINNRNAKLSKRNTSGIKGVSWSKRENAWVGSVWCRQIIYRTAKFTNKEDCATAVRELRIELHGEFARHD
jgi:hypothetical protein